MIEVLATETLTIRQETDVIALSSYIRRQATLAGMNSLSQTKLSTAASELARNILVHADGGSAQVERIRREQNVGLRLTFTDQGPGIADIERALQDGYSTGSGMGLGLPGAKRLTDEFSLTSVVGEGTTVTIIKWTND